MKTLVTYYSESGNTEKLAKAIYQGLAATESEIEQINEAKNFEEYDVIFVGFPVQGSRKLSEAYPGR